MARPSSRVLSTLAILSLVTALGLAFFATPILAQDGGDGGAGNETDGNETLGNETDGNATDGGAAGAGLEAFDYTITVREDPEHQEGDPYAFDISAFSLPPNARVHLIYDSTGATGLHNANPYEGVEGAEGALADGGTINPDSGRSSFIFTMPEEEGAQVQYRCDLHHEMTGTITAGAFGGGAGAGGHGIVEEGVSFLAHWVGVIAFAVLFIMYGLAFFLFKYNETPFTTDHKDRAVPAGAGVDVYGQDVRVSKGTAVVFALLLAALTAGLLWAVVNGYFAPGA